MSREMYDEETPAELHGPRAGQILADKYVVESVIGSGGMGVIVAARHVQLGQRVAIKLLTRAAARDATSSVRFLREAKNAAALRSDHVVRVYDVGTLTSGEPFIVMELLEGKDLATILSTEGPLPMGEVAEYVAQVADAVAEAHRAGIVHRDLKPANLFLTTRSDGRPSVKVLDFGISKTRFTAEDGALTASTSVVGSPLYMSPEQVRDARVVDGRGDIWSLGIIMYELLSGVPAFRAQTLTGICAAITADEPEPLGERRTDVPPELAAIVHRCLAKTPALRFQTADELKSALEPFRAAPNLGPQTLASRIAPASGSPLPSSLPVALDSPTLHSASSTLATEGRRRLPRWPLALAGTIVVGTLLVLALAPERGDPRTLPESALPPNVSGSFILTIDSFPQGAVVSEVGLPLGRTPLELNILDDSVSDHPRTFNLELDGYRAYALVQGPAKHAVRIVAPLAPASIAPVSSESAPTTPPAASAVGGRAGAAFPRAKVVPRASSEPASLDIRTER